MGGKRTKLPASAPTPAVSAVPEPAALLERAQGHLDRLLGTVEAGLAQGEVTPALVRESSGVARAIVAVSAEQRARDRAAEQADRQAAAGMTAANVIAFLRRTSAEDRRAVSRALQQIESDRTKPKSVLG